MIVSLAVNASWFGSTAKLIAYDTGFSPAGNRKPGLCSTGGGVGVARRAVVVGGVTIDADADAEGDAEGDDLARNDAAVGSVGANEIDDAARTRATNSMGSRRATTSPCVGGSFVARCARREIMRSLGEVT